MSFASIEHVLQRYFDALYFADADMMGSVLHPSAIYATADETEPLFRNMPEYLEVLRNRQPPADRGERRQDQTISIEFAGKRTALAKVRCSVGERRFTDFLSFVQVAGEWRIIAKVFAIDFTGNEV